MNSVLFCALVIISPHIHGISFLLTSLDLCCIFGISRVYLVYQMNKRRDVLCELNHVIFHLRGSGLGCTVFTMVLTDTILIRRSPVKIKKFLCWLVNFLCGRPLALLLSLVSLVSMVVGLIYCVSTSSFHKATCILTSGFIFFVLNLVDFFRLPKKNSASTEEVS